MSRLMNEYLDISRYPPNGISAGPSNESNLNEWNAILQGSPGTPYEGGIFDIKIIFPNDYPFKPPKITFLTPIFHCNINAKGEICIDILKDNWAPALTIDKVLLSIASLLDKPNPNDPLVPENAILYKNNKNEYDSLAREWTLKYAFNG